MYAVITGASSGIGLEMAKLLAEKHYNLVIAARRKERLEELKTFLEKEYGIDIVVCETDLCKESDVQNLYAIGSSYHPDIVINCAGFGKMGMFSSIPLKEDLDMIKTNVTALHILTRQFADSMEKGVILNVASIASFAPVPLLATYGATKAYVQNFSRAIQYELKKMKKPVHVMTLCPGPIATEFCDVAHGSFHVKFATAQSVAKKAIRGIFKKKAMVVPGFFPKFSHVGFKLLPTPFAMFMEYRSQDCDKV
ncbi:MAG: SDR family oxidoreductase [Clostridia bacterium]|nr:SDR family oxidoreductase [Clostridia bacterium]